MVNFFFIFTFEILNFRESANEKCIHQSCRHLTRKRCPNVAVLLFVRKVVRKGDF